jgi:NitT/TauT family transport system permease protein
MNDKRKHEKIPVPAQYGAAIIFWLALWIAIALIVGNPILIASPSETLLSFVQNLIEPDFWEAVLRTGMRIVCVSLVSALIATLLGFLAARINFIKVLLAPAMQVMKSAPVACIIVIVLVAAGSLGALVAIVAFVTIPPFYVAALEAQQARKIDIERVLLLEGAGKLRVFLASTWPTMLPFFSAAAKTAIALSWKAGITAELLCIPLDSIGAAVYAAKLTLDTPALLMWTITVMVLGWLNEKIAVGLLDASGKSARIARYARSSKQAALSDGTILPPSNSSVALELDRVRFSYADRLVLDDCSLRIGPDERLCLMAPTGTGKTTLLSLLIEKIEPQEGLISRPVCLGVVLQENTLIDDLSALQNVELTCRSGIDRNELVRKLTNLLPENTLHTKAAQLSGGTRRLTEIARALLSPGEAIVLDEPFTGLDRETNDHAATFILEHLEGRPLLFTTHDPKDAQRLDAHIAVMSENRCELSTARP